MSANFTPVFVDCEANGWMAEDYDNEQAQTVTLTEEAVVGDDREVLRQPYLSSRALTVVLATVALSAAGFVVAKDSMDRTAEFSGVAYPVSDHQVLDGAKVTVESVTGITNDEIYEIEINYIRDLGLEPWASDANVGVDYESLDLSILNSLSAIVRLDPLSDKPAIRLGRAAIIELDGELVVSTIMHVADDSNTNIGQNEAYYLSVPTIGEVRLNLYDKKAAVDLNQSVPDYLEPSSPRGDPNMVIPLPVEVQKYLRWLQGQGLFEPITISDKKMSRGDKLYVASHDTNKLIELEFKAVYERGRKTAEDLSIFGQYQLESTEEAKNQVSTYIQDTYGHRLSEQDKNNPFQLERGKDDAVLDQLMCQGFSGSAVFTRNQEGRLQLVGTVSNGIDMFVDNDGIHCGFVHGIEPV